MTVSDLLEHIFERLCRTPSREEIFGADETTQWPEGALEVLIKSGLLGRAEPAQVIECDGCERNCFMPVHVRPAEGTRPARAFICCDKPEDVGRVSVELGRLAQWRITGGMLANAMARLLGFSNPPHEDPRFRGEKPSGHRSCIAGAVGNRGRLLGSRGQSFEVAQPAISDRRQRLHGRTDIRVAPSVVAELIMRDSIAPSDTRESYHQANHRTFSHGLQEFAQTSLGAITHNAAAQPSEHLAAT